ncbi:MAG: metallophosphoesterase [Planctomycetia bacterium]|nr:metallophosphoesterase [Planctomycetia bacterium]
MQFWFTADTHFGHGNIIKYCQRPFLSSRERDIIRNDPRAKLRLSDETVTRHDEALLEAINSRVAEDDYLWILGDFCWGGLTEARYYRDRIRCKNVSLVWGNHDRWEIAPVFTETTEQRMIRVEGQEIWLNHYPMRSWNKAFHGSWHFYGHVHGRLQREDERNPAMLVKDLGVDACDYRPWSFSELADYMAPRLEAFNKHKSAFSAGQDDGSMPL